MNIILLSVLAAAAVSSIGVTPEIMVSNNNDLQQIQEKNTDYLEKTNKGITPRRSLPNNGIHTGTFVVDTSYRDLFNISGSRYRYYKEDQLYSSAVDPIYWPYLEVTGYYDDSGAEFDEIEVTFDAMKGAFVVLAEGYGNYCDGVIYVYYQYTEPTMLYGSMSVEAYYTSELHHVYQNVWGFTKEVQISGVDPIYWPYLEVTSYVDNSGADFSRVDVDFDQNTGIIRVDAITTNQYLDGVIDVYYRYERVLLGSVDLQANYSWEIKKFNDIDGGYYYLRAQEVAIEGVDSIYWPTVEYINCEDNSGSGFYEYDVTFDSARGVFAVFAKTRNDYLDGYITINYKYFPDREHGQANIIPSVEPDDDYYDDIDDSAFENAPVPYSEFTDSDDTRTPYWRRAGSDTMANAIPVTQSGKITGKLEYGSLGSILTFIDNDWYRLTVTEEADYYFKFQSPSSAYRFRVVKDRGSQTPLVVFNKLGSLTKNLHLTFGTYYIHVTANNKNDITNYLYTINYHRKEVRNDKFLLKPSMKRHYSMCVWENDALPDSIYDRWDGDSQFLYSVKGNDKQGYLDPYFLENDQVYLDSILYVWDEEVLFQIEKIAEGLATIVLNNYDEQDQAHYEELRVQFIKDTASYGVSIFNDILGFIPFVSYAATGASLIKDAAGLATTLINGIDTSFPRLKTVGEFCLFLGSLQTAAYYCRYYGGTMSLPRYAKVTSETKSGRTTYSWSPYYVEPNYTYRQYFHYTNACISQYQTITSNNGGQAKTFHGSLMPLIGSSEIGRLFNITDNIY